MVYEFEGKTEKEAIEIAIKSLGLERNQFDVELLDTEKGGLFSLQKKVHIKVYTQDNERIQNGVDYYNPNPEPENDIEHKLVAFIETLVTKMGYEVGVGIMYREDRKIAFRLDSKYGAILIGRKGQNLDAIQLLTNVLANRLNPEGVKIIVDMENYRGRREEALIRLAHTVGDQVIRTKKAKLMEPMNPFERRLIHTALNDIENIETSSEGNGPVKQIRVSYKGM